VCDIWPYHQDVLINGHQVKVTSNAVHGWVKQKTGKVIKWRVLVYIHKC